MALDLDEETREALGWGEPMGWVAEWLEHRRQKHAADQLNRDPLKKRLHDKARKSRSRNEGYKQRKRKRDAERIAAKRQKSRVAAGKAPPAQNEESSHV